MLVNQVRKSLDTTRGLVPEQRFHQLTREGFRRRDGRTSVPEIVPTHATKVSSVTDGLPDMLNVMDRLRRVCARKHPRRALHLRQHVNNAECCAFDGPLATADLGSGKYHK